MINDSLELIHGSGNVFRDFALPDAEIQQTKAILAAEIIKALDDGKLSVRAAHDLTGFAAADFSRIRNANLSRFTVERLIGMLCQLGREVEISVSVRVSPRLGGHR